MEHLCKTLFVTEKIDECCGMGENKCYGMYPMVVEMYVQGKDGTECYYDCSVEMKVKFCPFCGLKAINNADEQEGIS